MKLNIFVKCIVLLLCILSVESCQKVEENQNITKLLIGDPVKLDELDDLFSNVELIFLDSRKEAFLKPARNMHILNDTIYIEVEDKVVFSFDRFGAFLSNTKSIRGRSRKEIWAPSDFLINPYTHNIEMLSLHPSTAILVYDKSMKFIERIDLPEECGIIDCFEIIDPDTYLFYTIERNEDKNGEHSTMIRVYSKGDDKIVSKIAVEERFKQRIISSNDPKVFYKSGINTFFMSNRQTNTIFKVDPHGENLLVPEYHLELKHNPLTPEAVKNISDDDPTGLLFGENMHNYSLFMKRFITDKYIVINYSYKTKINTYIYNRQTKKSVCFDNIFNSGEIIQPPILVTDSAYYSILEPSWIPYRFPTYSFDDATMQRIKGLSKYDDNQIVVKYTFKDNI